MIFDSLQAIARPALQASEPSASFKAADEATFHREPSVYLVARNRAHRLAVADLAPTPLSRGPRILLGCRGGQTATSGRTKSRKLETLRLRLRVGLPGLAGGGAVGGVGSVGCSGPAGGLGGVGGVGGAAGVRGVAVTVHLRGVTGIRALNAGENARRGAGVAGAVAVPLAHLA